MANDLNQFTFTGRLGKDPESRALPSGESVCNFSVAVGSSWKDKASGAKQERTEWVGCAVFGKLAEICTQYLRKGSQIAAVGELRTRKWQDKDGKDRWTTEVILNQMTMMGGKPADAAPASDKPAQTAKSAPAAASKTTDGDVPF
jgi:single-strand DNA-binding protein